MRPRPQLIKVKETLASVLKEDRLSAREQLCVGNCSDPVDEARTTEDTMVAIAQLDVALNNRHQARAGTRSNKARTLRSLCSLWTGD